MMKIGLFGGSFNPIHNGHIALSQAILQQCGLDEVWLMVSPQNPLKEEGELLDDELRLKLARMALEGIRGIKVSDYEMQLPKPSYTWHTLQSLSRAYPAHTFVLLIGGDNWRHFERWYHWQDILRRYDVIVYPRDQHPGTVQVPLLDVSSTEIREKVKQGKDIQGLVPENIIPLVKQYYR